jgi:hypothetical protein
VGKLQLFQQFFWAEDTRTPNFTTGASTNKMKQQSSSYPIMHPSLNFLGAPSSSSVRTTQLTAGLTGQLENLQKDKIRIQRNTTNQLNQAHQKELGRLQRQNSKSFAGERMD